MPDTPLLLPVNSENERAQINQIRIYRYFKKEEHANDLMNGKVWIGTLELYRKIEDQARKDTGEGTLHYKSGFVKGNQGDPVFDEIARRSAVGLSGGAKNVYIVNHQNFMHLENAFVLCASLDSNLSDFGKHCVEITRPVDCFDLLCVRLGSSVRIDQATMGRVEYGDRSYTGLEAKRIGFVKPLHFQHDREYRMLWPTGSAKIIPQSLIVPEITKYFRRIT